jgi:hypothetical protein
MGQHVRVHVQRESDARVPEHLGNDLWRYTGGECQRGGGVTKVIKVDVGGQLRRAQYALEVPLRQITFV